MAARRKYNRLATPGTEGERNPLEQAAGDLSMEMMAFINRMEPEEAISLKHRLGLLIPVHLTVKSDIVRWRYMCPQCQGVALSFRGEQFTVFDADKERFYNTDSPPINVPLEDLPWFQEGMERENGSRSPFRARCPLCGAPIALRDDRSLISSLIKETKVKTEELTKPPKRRGRKKKDGSGQTQGSAGVGAPKTGSRRMGTVRAAAGAQPDADAKTRALDGDPFGTPTGGDPT